MKLTRINIKNGDVAKVEVEMSCHEFYRIVDVLKERAQEAHSAFELAEKDLAAAQAAGKVEKAILDTFNMAKAAVDQGTIKKAEGEFCAVED